MRAHILAHRYVTRTRACRKARKFRRACLRYGPHGAFILDCFLARYVPSPISIPED